MTNAEIPYVVLLATGGTISSRTRADSGDAVAADDGSTILGSLRRPSAHPVRVRDVINVGSYLLTVPDMLTICEAIADALADPLALGVVVTHGTDTMEETAFLADLTLDDNRPVIFTGAQKSADALDPDGPANLANAIRLASSPAARGRGAMICFDGDIYPAAGAVKAATIALHAFANPESGALGSISTGSGPRFSSPPQRGPHFALPRTNSDGPRVDLVAVYPGADATQFEASVAAGAKGIVLQATGSGNANHALCDAVAAATAQGIVVVTSTRVHTGPVVAIYGNGGGKTLLAAGAILSGTLRPSQSLVLLSLLLRLGRSPGEIAHEFGSLGGSVPELASTSTSGR